MTHALASRWYRDPQIYDRERHTVWTDEWLMFAPADLLREPGAYVADEVAGFPVFVVVQPDGSLAGFHNVCAHRAGVIVWPGEGHTANLVCRYHGWDGALKSARDFGAETPPCTADNSLRSIAVERWRNLVFVRLGGPGSGFSTSNAAFADACAPYALDSFHFARRMTREIGCNWKTYVDNYLEGYHISLLHPSLLRALDMGTYRVEVPDPSYCVHTCDTVGGSPAGGAWLFRYPNLAVNVYADGMNVERIVPVGHDRTRILYDYFGRDGADSGIDTMIEMSNVVLDEDQAICEAVQRNLDAGVYEAGPLSPRHEAALSWFQDRVATAVGLGDDAAN